MISLVSSLPDFYIDTVEKFKIKANFSLYSDIALFWCSSEGGIISYLDRNAVITGDFSDDELICFLNMNPPASIFCDKKTADKILLDFKREDVCVFYRFGKSDVDFQNGDTLKSDEIYKLLNVEGLNLPEKDFFLVDFCRRLNHSALCYYAERNVCAAVGLLCDGVCLVTGIASHKKGSGSLALERLIKKSGKEHIFAAARSELAPFYIKCGFEKLYNAAYLTR